MRGRPFEFGNTFGQGRPPGSRNKKGLMLQKLLLNHGNEIIRTLIDRAKQGDRVALTLCVERLIPRLKDIEELPEDPQHTKRTVFDPAILSDRSVLTDEELDEAIRLFEKLQGISDDGRARVAQHRPAVTGDEPAAA